MDIIPEDHAKHAHAQHLVYQYLDSALSNIFIGAFWILRLFPTVSFESVGDTVTYWQCSGSIINVKE